VSKWHHIVLAGMPLGHWVPYIYNEILYFLDLKEARRLSKNNLSFLIVPLGPSEQLGLRSSKLAVKHIDQIREGLPNAVRRQLNICKQVI
jgi:hypothetical protein